ncbi:MAG TPA: enoyl-CoA hydratase-related protein [Pseudonocardiaceae bacterium]|nr:enoyl-CoA hydratase-related protein [Pseudonocardiaceae bacterium]
MPADAFTVTRQPETGIAELRLHGTSSGNAMGAAVWHDLPEVVAELESDESVRAVVLRGADDCFSVGLDLRWYLTHYRRMIRASDGGQAMRRQLAAEAEAMQGAISTICASPLPFVAAVHGACVGAGLDLVAACDIRFASAPAYFSLREVRIGVVADLGSLQRLPRMIGAGPTREWALTGRDVSADEAWRRGLVSRVFADSATLFLHAHTIAEQIASHPPHVVAGVKNVMEQTQDLSVPAGLRYVGVWNAAFLPSQELPDLLAAALRTSATDPPGRTFPTASENDTY